MRHTNDPLVTATNQIEQVRGRFELWRRDHPERRRIPEELWAAAVNLAQQFGMNRTARVLRLSYESLKQHMPAGSVVRGNRQKTTMPKFVEVLPLSSATMPECSVELENGRGAKIRIQLKGAAMGELPNLTRLFWREL